MMPVVVRGAYLCHRNLVERVYLMFCRHLRLLALCPSLARGELTHRLTIGWVYLLDESTLLGVDLSGAEHH